MNGTEIKTVANPTSEHVTNFAGDCIPACPACIKENQPKQANAGRPSKTDLYRAAEAFFNMVCFRWPGAVEQIEEVAGPLRDALKVKPVETSDQPMEFWKSEAIGANTTIRQLKEAIYWALGERDAFPEEPEPLAGKYRRRYHWRTELRKRSGLPINGQSSSVEPSAPQDESGWLIELAMKGVPHWLMVSSVREWTPDAIKAVRFAREEDAEAMLFFLGIEDSKATEHAWVATSPRECGPPADHCEKHGPHRAFAGGCPGCYHEKHDLPRAQEKAKAPLCNCVEGVCHGQAVAQIYGRVCRTESK